MKNPTKKGKYLVKYFNKYYSPVSGENSYIVYHTRIAKFDGKKFEQANVIEWQSINWETYE